MIHRHLDLASDGPVDELPAVAIADILDRGDLDEWRPIAAVVAAFPHGEMADTVERLLNAYPMYGTSPLWRAWIDRCRARVEGPLRPGADPLTRGEIRRRRGMTQIEVAAGMGITQSDVSKLERRPDLRVSTLRSFAQSMGGRLRLLIRFPDGDVELR